MVAEKEEEEGGREFLTWKKSPLTRFTQGLDGTPFPSFVLPQHNQCSLVRMFSIHLVIHGEDLTSLFDQPSALVEVMCTEPGLQGFKQQR